MSNLKDWFNWQMMQGIVRHVLNAGGTLLTAQGVLSADQANTMIGATMVIAGVLAEVISARTKKKAMAIAKAVDVSLDVEAVKSPVTGKTIIRPFK